jgi:hypothetical protein
MDEIDEIDDNPLTPIDVRRAIAAEYSGAEREAASLALRKYRGPEGPRVQIAILVLAKRHADAIAQYVDHAKEDFRDVLSWAEWPRESGYGTKKEMRERYRALGVPVPGSLK